MKSIATDAYTFEKLINDNKVYVDKTAVIRQLIHTDSGYEFFMSRPRRFGKSLLVSTLRAIFEGRRELFKGLAIDSSDYDWKKYPVIHLDMTLIKDSEPANMKNTLVRQLRDRLAASGVSVELSDAPGYLFGRLVTALAAASPERKVVVLIDEYDAPVSGFLDRPEKLRAARELLHDFYVVLKAHDADIRFLFMTGVSKFTKLSVFSGLNNLNDITMDAEYATLLGYTPEELATNFREHIQAFADKREITFGAMVDELRSWYNGYRFSPESDATVLNPVSAGSALAKRVIKNYWESTGNATLIIERLRKSERIPADLDSLTASPSGLDVCDADALPLKSLLYQSGYLTIKSVDANGRLRLGVPNREIRESLDTGYVRDVVHADADDVYYAARDAVGSFAAGDADAVCASLTALYASIPAEWMIKDESEAKRFFLLFFSLAGADITPEAQSSRGRADAVVKTADAVYILEFKYGKSAAEALDQIRARGYAAPFAGSGKKIVLIGVNFNPKIRTLDPPAMERA